MFALLSRDPGLGAKCKCGCALWVGEMALNSGGRLWAHVSKMVDSAFLQVCRPCYVALWRSLSCSLKRSDKLASSVLEEAHVSLHYPQLVAGVWWGSWLESGKWSILSVGESEGWGFDCLKNWDVFLKHFLSLFLKGSSSLRRVQRTTLTSSRLLSAWWTLSVIRWRTASRATLLKPPEHPQPNWATTLYRPSSPSAAASDTYAGCVYVYRCVCGFCAVANLSFKRQKYITEPQGLTLGWLEALQNSGKKNRTGFPVLSLTLV